MADLKTILDRIRKPLHFAARDDFAHLTSLTAIESFMSLQVEELKRIAGDRNGLKEMGALFSGFDALSPVQKKDRILRAAQLIDAIEHDTATPSEKRRPLPRRPEAQSIEGTKTSPEPDIQLQTPVHGCFLLVKLYPADV